MKYRTLLMSLLVLGLLAAPVLAQLPGPDLPKLSNLTFGWVSMSGVDPTLEMLTSFAPTSMALRDAGYHTGGEMVSGRMSFSDLDVNVNFESAMTALGPGLLRLCRYSYESNQATIKGMPAMPASTSGDSIELSYAQHVGPATIGISLVPQDSTDIAMFGGGQKMIDGTLRTDYGARAGAVIRLPHTIRLGVDYSYQKDSGTLSVNPALVNPLLAGNPWIESKDDFITRCGTIGASIKVRPKTTVYTAYQNILATGKTLGHRNADLVWGGVTQELATGLSVRANYLDGGGNYSVQWRSPIGIVNIAYTHKALMNAHDILGNGDAVFGALALAF